MKEKYTFTPLRPTITVNFISCKFYLFFAIYFLFPVNITNAQTYCTPSFDNPSQHYISRVQLNTIDNTSTFVSTTDSFSDFTGISTDLLLGQTYTLTINTFRVDTWRAAGYGVWIDYNGNGDFTDAGETIWEFGTSTASSQSTTFIVPGSATVGSFRMRINMVSWYTPGSCAVDGSNFGETEDYTINIIQSPDPIAVTDNLSVIKNSMAGTPNQIDVGSNDDIGSEGGDSDNYSLNTTASNGTVVEISDGIFEYIPNTDFIGVDSFIYNICDVGSDCASAIVNITVNFGQCIPVSNSNGTHYITDVSSTGEGGSIINNTTGDNSGYADFTGSEPVITYFKGNSYPFSISVNNSDSSNMGWSVYIDLNSDADFEDPGELLYDTGGTESIPFATQNITIPTSAINGNTALRVGTRRYYSSNQPCGQTGNPEEFEDYLVNLQIDPSSSAEMDITGNSNNVMNGSSTTSLSNNTDFGVYDIYSTIPLQKTFIITNNGGLDLDLTGAPLVQISGSPDFSITTQPSVSTLTLGSSTTFTVSFSPSAPTLGQRTATISITSNDADENPYAFVIEGYGEQTFPDTDNDGIPDNVDIDDDNDGLLDQLEQVSCASNLIATTTDVVFLNEDFETGTGRSPITGASYCFEDGTGSCGTGINLEDGEYVVYYQATNGDSTDDTPSGEVASWADDYWYPGLDHTPGDINGRMAMFNAAEDPGIFYETTITGVSSGVDITYGFSALNLDRADIDPTELSTRERPSVLIEILDPTGSLIASSSSGLIEPTTDYVTGDWAEVTATFNTSYTQFTVRLTNENLGGLGNDLAIDDIFVLQTLCDLDGDGVEDSVDLDNDDDGIPNVVELQLTDNDKDGTVNNDSGAFVWADINNNGLHDLYDPQDASGRNAGDVGFSGALGTEIDLTNPIYDTDGDGVLDYLDLDSDNDGVFDALEYDNRGDTDINGDGNGDGSDKSVLDASDVAIDNDEFDGDGILGPADANDSDSDGLDHGTGSAYPTPLDDDGDGIPNFRDVDSADNPNDFSNGSDIDKMPIYAHLDANDDGVLDDTVDTDKDGILDIFDTDNTVYGSPRDLNGSYTLFFDGRNDYVEEASVIDGWTDVTIMCWVKIEPGSSGKRVIVGQDEIQLFITTGGNVSAVANGNTLSSAVITTGLWVHVAAIYNGTSGVFTLYINGEQDATTTVSGALPSDTSSFTLGRTPDTDSDYYEGEIDEVRVFTKALTELELQKMVYQELTTAERGAIIPIDISGALAGTLSRYYKMDTYSHDITSNNASGAKMYNIKNIYFQTAPLPYETTADGDWSAEATWLYGSVWDIEDEVNNKDWSIVNIKHETTTSNTHKTLGLIVGSGAELEINNNVELQNSWYLSLNGKIDLQGSSQLVQTENSSLVAGASGTLEKDQQGTVNLYTYNYWSSPVHTTNPNALIDGDEGYTVAGVLRDGKDPLSPEPITFVTGTNYDGDNTTTPIELSDYWIWKYSNLLSDTYALWQQVRSSGALLVGEGYTMKGPGTGSVSSNKNYVFVGTPNNGEITLEIDGGNSYLVGNPYPSAIDGHEFLLDNTHLEGTLYFWEHFGGGSHFLIEYQGGYASYNLSGGVPALNGIAATSDPDVDQTGTGSKIPKRYIPVSQGFFVNATSDGDIKFENDQRIFVTETGGTNSLFIKKSNKKTTPLQNDLEDVRPKLRISYKSPKGYSRQLLVTVDENASYGYDWGYDGLLDADELVNNLEDMYWDIDDYKCVIQGIGAIEPLLTKLPLVVKTNKNGAIEIGVDTLENVTNDTEIYLSDKENNTIHNLRTSKFITTVTKGVMDDRFEIVFAKPSNNLSVSTNDELQKSIGIFYDNSEATLHLINSKNLTIKSLSAVNVLGQRVLEEDVNSSGSNIILPSNLITGVYIFIIETEDTKITRKMIIQ